MDLKHTLIILALFCLVLGLFLFAPRMLQGLQNQPARVMPMAGSTVGGPFALTDHMGQPVSQKNYADRYKLIFFGFTWCPSICPMELSRMADVLGKLNKDADKVYPLFITIDPARDTPEVLKKYVAQFDPRIIGLTGTEQEIKNVVASYKVYAAKVDQDGGDYTMDHSAFTYLMSPDNQLVAIYKTSQSVDEIAADLQARLAQ